MKAAARKLLVELLKTAVVIAMAGGVYLSVRGTGVNLPVPPIVGVGAPAHTLVVHAPPARVERIRVRPHVRHSRPKPAARHRSVPAASSALASVRVTAPVAQSSSAPSESAPAPSAPASTPVHRAASPAPTRARQVPAPAHRAAPRPKPAPARHTAPKPAPAPKPKPKPKPQAAPPAPEPQPPADPQPRKEPTSPAAAASPAPAEEPAAAVAGTSPPNGTELGLPSDPTSGAKGR